MRTGTAVADTTGLAQRHIGRSEKRSQQDRLPELELREQGQCNPCAGGNSQWKSSRQHPQRQIVIPAQACQVDSGGVGEQHQNQRQLCNHVDGAVTGLQVGDSEHSLADDISEDDEDQRRRNDGSLPALGAQ
jgi:hypothetical protein